MEKEVKESKRLKMVKDGLLNEQYTQKGWFVKVYPAYGIEKVRFSFVKKALNEAEKGKNAFNVYMDIDTFDNWCDDILDRILPKVIASEKAAGEKYPKFYKFITGDNGQKSVGIVAASSGEGYVINGVADKTYANVPVDFNWLRTTAKYFKRTTDGKFAELADMIVVNSNKYFNGQNVDDGESYEGGSAAKDESSKTKNTTVQNEAGQKEQKPEAPKEQTPKSTGEATPNQKEESEMKRCSLFTSSEIVERKSKKGDFTFRAIPQPLSHGKVPQGVKEYNIVVKADVITTLGKVWNEFFKVANEQLKNGLSTDFKCCYTKGTEMCNGKKYQVVYLQSFL